MYEKKVKGKSSECRNHKPQPIHQEKKETDKSKQIEQMYEKH